MQSIHAVNDNFLGKRIESAKSRIIYAAPGVGTAVATALVRAIVGHSVSVTIILDSDEDAYRIGYGEPQALLMLHEAAKCENFMLRRQAGLRIGLLVLDDDLIIWSPTAQSVEPERVENQPNAVLLSGLAVGKVTEALGVSPTQSPSKPPEIGRELLRSADLKKMIDSLEANPPAPFDLAHKSRVFSTRFQFVEFEVQGAEWTERKIKISSFLLNADLPESIQDSLETQIRPYQSAADIAIEVPSVVQGQIAFNREGQPILTPMRQADLDAAWKHITKRYLVKVKGFGWLIRKTDWAAFSSAADAYATVLQAWGKKFRENVEHDDERLITEIAKLIQSRVEKSSRKAQFEPLNLKDEVRKGLAMMRVIEPKVRIVPKGVAPESTRDPEFTEAIKAALPAKELEGWFEEFTAARERGLRQEHLSLENHG